jgi:hypothetical protein
MKKRSSLFNATAEQMYNVLSQVGGSNRNNLLSWDGSAETTAIAPLNNNTVAPIV